MYKRLLGMKFVRCSKIMWDVLIKTQILEPLLSLNQFVLFCDETKPDFKKFQPLEVGSDPSNETNKIQVKIINQKLNNMLKTLWKFHTRFHVTLRGIIWSGAIINFKSRKDESLSLFNFGRKYPFVDRPT